MQVAAPHTGARHMIPSSLSPGRPPHKPITAPPCIVSPPIHLSNSFFFIYIFLFFHFGFFLSFIHLSWRAHVALETEHFLPGRLKRAGKLCLREPPFFAPAPFSLSLFFSIFSFQFLVSSCLKAACVCIHGLALIQHHDGALLLSDPDGRQVEVYIYRFFFPPQGDAGRKGGEVRPVAFRLLRHKPNLMID